MNDEHHKRDCLAKYICNMQTIQERRGFIKRLEKRHIKSFVDDIKQRVMDNWKK